MTLIDYLKRYNTCHFIDLPCEEVAEEHYRFIDDRTIEIKRLHAYEKKFRQFLTTEEEQTLMNIHDYNNGSNEYTSHYYVVDEGEYVTEYCFRISHFKLEYNVELITFDPNGAEPMIDHREKDRLFIDKILDFERKYGDNRLQLIMYKRVF